MVRDAGVSYRAGNLDAIDRHVADRLVATLWSGVVVGRSSLFVRLEEAVQISRNGEWRGICDDSFTPEVGQVLCRMAGLSYVSHASVAGRDSFWIDSISCNGSETSIDQCSGISWGDDDCSGGENVHLVCR